MTYQTVYKAMIKKADGLDPAFIENAKLQTISMPKDTKMVGVGGRPKAPGRTWFKAPNGKKVTSRDIGYAAGGVTRDALDPVAKTVEGKLKSMPEAKRLELAKSLQSTFGKYAPIVEAMGRAAKKTPMGQGFADGFYSSKLRASNLK